LEELGFENEELQNQLSE